MLRYDSLVKETHVICCHCALARTGLIVFNPDHLELFTENKSLGAKMSASVVTYYYNPHIDYKTDVIPSKSNPLLLCPTKERAIVECIKFIKYVDEGLLIEALQSYIDNFWNNRIYAVGDHFGVNKKTLDYWFEEARNEYEM